MTYRSNAARTITPPANRGSGVVEVITRGSHGTPVETRILELDPTARHHSAPTMARHATYVPVRWHRRPKKG